MSQKQRGYRAGQVIHFLTVPLVYYESSLFALIPVLLYFGIWRRLVRWGTVGRSRYLGGLIMIVLSLPMIVAALFRTWGIVLGALWFVYGSWLAMSAAARLSN